MTQIRQDIAKAATSDDCCEIFGEWAGYLVETERLHAESAEEDKVSQRRATTECILLEKKAASEEADKIATQQMFDEAVMQQMFDEAVELACNVQESLDRLRAEDAVQEATQKAAEAALKAAKAARKTAETKSANDARISWLIH